MQFTIYVIVDPESKIDMINNINVYEATMEKPSIVSKPILKLTIDNNKYSQVIIDEEKKIFVYRIRIKDNKVINYMIYNDLEYYNRETDDKYCKITFTISGVLTKKVLVENGSDINQVQNMMQDIYDGIYHSGKIIIHELDEEIEK